HGLAVAPDGKQIAVRAQVRVLKGFVSELRVIDVASGRIIQTLSRAEREYVQAFAFSAQGADLVSLNSARTLRVEEIASGKERLRTRLPQAVGPDKNAAPRGTVAVSPNAKLVAFPVGTRLCVRGWSADVVRDLPGAYDVRALVFSTDGK